MNTGEIMSIGRSLVLVDAHVHIHDCFALPRFLNSAYANFRDVAARKEACNGFTGMLLLAETARANWFKRLTTLADNGHTSETAPLGEWHLRHTAESCSLLVERRQNEHIFIIAGRQIVTAENLEVLALGTDAYFPDGAPITAVIEAVRASGALVAIPWGFGKWWGRRGLILKELLDKQESLDLFLGDNSGRPVFLRNPRHFKQAIKKGIQIFPGSDPLPFPSEYWRPGSVGLMIRAYISEKTPASNLKQILRDQAISIKPYGRLENPYRFLRNQFAMQLVKFKRKHDKP
jgi:hypothetical protein